MGAFLLEQIMSIEVADDTQEDERDWYEFDDQNPPFNVPILVWLEDEEMALYAVKGYDDVIYIYNLDVDDDEELKVTHWAYVD
jgi:hypothetical protein